MADVQATSSTPRISVCIVPTSATCSIDRARIVHIKPTWTLIVGQQSFPSTKMHLTFLAVAAILAALSRAQTSGTTTRYWDCCKDSCSWPGKGSVTSPVGACDANCNPLSDTNAPSGCPNGGSGAAYTCSNNSPWAVSDTLAYGFAAINFSGAGLTEQDWCCTCYQLTFTDAPVAGQQMIVQVTNTGSDLVMGQSDLQIPGGGAGLNPAGCDAQYGTQSSVWGDTYGGVATRADCSNLPSSLVAGCQFRFDWMKGASNPAMTYQLAACPSALTSVTGCART